MAPCKKVLLQKSWQVTFLARATDSCKNQRTIKKMSCVASHTISLIQALVSSEPGLNFRSSENHHLNQQWAGQQGTGLQPCPDPSHLRMVQGSAPPKSTGTTGLAKPHTEPAASCDKEQRQPEVHRELSPIGWAAESPQQQKHGTEPLLHGSPLPRHPALPPTTAFQYRPFIFLNSPCNGGKKTKTTPLFCSVSFLKQK